MACGQIAILICVCLTGTCFSLPSFLERSSNVICVTACSETALPFPLDGLASEWPASLFSPCNYTCQVSQCKLGCGSGLSSGNLDACLNDCRSSVSEAACSQGCHLALRVIRSRLTVAESTEVVDGAVLDTTLTNTSIELYWRLPLRQVQLEFVAVDWIVQSSPGLVAAWTSLPEPLQFDEQQRAWLTMRQFNGSALQPDCNYQFRLVASLANGGGSVVATSVFERRTPIAAGAPPPRPPVFTLELWQLHDQLLICWRPDDGADLQVERRFQVLLRRCDSDESGGHFNDTTAASCYAFTNLIGGQSYEAQVAQVNSIGVGPPANVTRFTVTSSPSRVSQMIFADSKHVYTIDNEGQFLSDYTIIISLEDWSADDEISAIASLSSDELLVGTRAGHVLQLTRGKAPFISKFVRWADDDETGVGVREIASDWIQGVVYILFDESLLVCDDDCRTFAQFTKGSIRQITPDPLNGFLYWMAGSRVYRAPLLQYGDWQATTDLWHISRWLRDLQDVGAIALDLFSAALLVTTRDGRLLSRSLVSGAETEARVERAHNHDTHLETQAKARRLIVNDRSRLFWLIDDCSTRPNSGCLYSLNIRDRWDAADRCLNNLQRYAMYDTIGRLVDLAWLADKPNTLSLPACSDVEMVQSAETLRLRWRPPSLLPFQSTTEWRRLTYDVKVGDEIRQEDLTAETFDFHYYNNSDAAEHRASVRACWAGICSTWTERVSAIKQSDLPSLPVVFLDSRSDIQTIDLLGDELTPIADTAKPGPSMHKSRPCFEYDPLTDQSYWCTSEGVVRTGRRRSDDAQLVVLATDFRWSALLSTKAVLALASPYQISAYRLTGTFFKSYYSCDVAEMSSCQSVEGVAPSESDGGFLYLLRDQSGLVSAYFVRADGQLSNKVSSEGRQLPRLKQLRSHGIQVIAITQDDELILFDRHLTTVSRIRSAHRPTVLLNAAPVVGSKKLLPATSAVIRSINGKTYVEWAPASGGDFGAVLTTITINSASGHWRWATSSPQQLALPAPLVESWPAHSELTVEVAATSAWQTTIGSALANATVNQDSHVFPSPPRHLHAIARTPDSVALFWQSSEFASAPPPLDQMIYIIYLENRMLPNASYTSVSNGDQQMKQCIEFQCSAIVKQLEPDTQYRFKVWAMHANYSNAAFEGRHDGAVSVAVAWTLPLPGRLSARATSRHLTLLWQLSKQQGVAGVRIMLQVRETGSTDTGWTNATAAPLDAQTPSTRIVGGLRPNTAYDIGYVAIYHFAVPHNATLAEVPLHGHAQIAYFQKTEGIMQTTAEVPSAVTDVSVADDAAGLYVMWQPPASDGGSEILAYILDYRAPTDADWIRADDAISNEATSWRPNERLGFADLTTDMDYRVAPRNQMGLGPFAEAQKDTNGATAVVAIPIALFVIGIIALLLIVVGTQQLWVFGARPLASAGLLARRRRERKPHAVATASLTPTPIVPDAIDHGLVGESPQEPVDITRQIAAEDLHALPHVPRSCITIAHMLGKGAFGEVHEGLACKLQRVGPKSVPVAIKTLQQGCSDHDRLKFLQEAILMSNFNHPNVLRLLGVCLEAEPNWIVLELMEGGDLLSFLRRVRPSESMPSQVSLTDLLSLAADVLKGCTYLESIRHVHRDLAARNCLISTRYSGMRTVKIADFGLARDIYEADYYRVDGDALLPVRWMAPESMADGEFTTKSDVWSFGVVLWEIVSLGQQPYSARANIHVPHFVHTGGRLQSPDHCPARLYCRVLGDTRGRRVAFSYALMRECWCCQPDNRPPFAELQTRMERLRALPELSGEQPFPPDAPLADQSPSATAAPTPSANEAARVLTTATDSESPRNSERNAMNDVEETMERLGAQKGVVGVLVMDADGRPIKSTLDQQATLQHAQVLQQLAEKARASVKQLDGGNELTFIRLRTRKHEIMLAPDKDYLLAVIQTPDNS